MYRRTCKCVVECKTEAMIEAAKYGLFDLLSHHTPFSPPWLISLTHTQTHPALNICTLLRPRFKTIFSLTTFEKQAPTLQYCLCILCIQMVMKTMQLVNISITQDYNNKKKKKVSEITIELRRQLSDVKPAKTKRKEKRFGCVALYCSTC